MSAILYPVAENAAEALAKPLGRAARAREAGELARGEVQFVSEETGPAFPTREAALDAFAGRLDDDRPGRLVQVAPEDRFCSLRERMDAPPAPMEPINADGRRWPRPRGRRAAARFRLCVSYWRIDAGEPRPEEAAEQARGQARDLRRRTEAARLDAVQLRALARQPLRPLRPQQPLDSGLFEAPAPEAPHILIPDE